VKRKLFTALMFFYALSGIARENIVFGLYTDRDLYASGETLMIKVFAPTDEQTGIVNIDLISSRSSRIITGVILEIIDYQADGYISLPDSLSSGCYLLRTSTRSSGIQTIKEVYIVNRFTGIPGANEVLRPVGVIPVTETQIQTIKFNGVSQSYKRREHEDASIHLSDDLLSQIDGNVCVSIAKVAPSFHPMTFTVNMKSAPGQIIEKEGIILEGVVTDLKTALPFKDATVYLSILDSLPWFEYYITGEDGRFFFHLKRYYGKIPVVLQCYDKANIRQLKITLVDSESLRSELPAVEIKSFPPELKKEVLKYTETVTIRKIFDQQEITVLPPRMPKHCNYPFYGIPTNILDSKLFIDLPDFNVISRELLPGVKFRTYNRIPTLQVLNTSMRNYFNDPPLVLLDGIPVRDLNVIKDLGSKMISRVEICLNERFYGDLIFPGVVAIYTLKADYAQVPESYDLIKLNLDVIQQPATLNFNPGQMITEPDLRQVLLWKPSLKPEKTIPVDFQTSDVKGSYKLMLSGKNKNGVLFFNEQIFEVK